MDENKRLHGINIMFPITIAIIKHFFLMIREKEATKYTRRIQAATKRKEIQKNALKAVYMTHYKSNFKTPYMTCNLNFTLIRSIVLTRRSSTAYTSKCLSPTLLLEICSKI